MVIIGLLYPARVCKDKVIERILSSQKIIDLLGDEEYQTAPAPGLLYKKVFPFARIPETTDIATPFICCETNIPAINSDTVCDVELTIFVTCYTNAMRGEFGTIIDMIADEIDNEINHMRGFGIGKLTPATRFPVDYTLPNYNYVSRKMVYLLKDFNFRHGGIDYG